MKTTTGRSPQHQRTRNDHATETAEDYTEAVFDLIESQSECRLRDLAKHFGVTHVTANKIVARLAKEGLLSTQPYQPIGLTPTGRKLAIQCKKRHETVYRFLRCLGIDEATSRIDSEGIEHHVSPKTLKAFEAFVANFSSAKNSEPS
jgi:DtxR family transcriptional regulator, manganese transport regulator